MRIEDIIKAVQQNIGTETDGRGGPETWLALYKLLVAPTLLKTPFKTHTNFSIAAVDAKSEAMIITLLPPVQIMARALVQKAHTAGIKIKITSGSRTYKEQDALYAQGRTAPGEIVTKMKAGFSNHNFGIAFDFAVFEGNTMVTDSPKYKAVAVLGMDIGLEWGGNWRDTEDQGHFQLRPAWASNLSERQMLTVLRERLLNGRSIYT